LHFPGDHARTPYYNLFDIHEAVTKGHWAVVGSKDGPIRSAEQGGIETGRDSMGGSGLKGSPGYGTLVGGLGLPKPPGIYISCPPIMTQSPSIIPCCDKVYGDHVSFHLRSETAPCWVAIQ